MNLSKYENALAQRREQVELPISDAELCKRYEAVFTAAVNDVLREDGLLWQTLPNNIMPLDKDMKVCGIVFTIKGMPSLDMRSVDVEMEERAKLLEKIKPDSVVVWDTSHDEGCAQWGEVMTAAVIQRGCRGAVIDGGIRDTDRIIKQNFPVFYRYRTSNAMLGRFITVANQVPIRIGEVDIFPGDVVFGDIDGVIIVPRSKAYDVLLRAERIRDNEKEIRKMVSDGMEPTEVVARGGYF